MTIPFDWTEELDQWARRTAEDMLIGTAGAIDSGGNDDGAVIENWLRRVWHPAFDPLIFRTTGQTRYPNLLPILLRNHPGDVDSASRGNLPSKHLATIFEVMNQLKAGGAGAGGVAR